MNIQQKITCPTCSKQNTWRPDNTFRPFCSSRCKLIDLGEWASETRTIQGDPVDPDLLHADNHSNNDSGEHFF